ncbi:MAG: DUF4139 domain-containing protein [Rhodospirillaceae bacterium]|jgi:hypothetical protein|nr:DUF4139 domain-containing protein [Rhodospirillaceae bacterium]
MRMQRTFMIAAAAVSLVSTPVPSPAWAQAPVSTETRSDLALTIYGNGLGLVSDRRWANFTKGLNELSLEGLSPKILSDSLVTEISGGAKVLSRERLAANLTPRAVMNANVGKAGFLVRQHPGTGAEISEPATLLSVQGGIVARIGGRVVLNPDGRWAFANPALGAPEGLRPHPVLKLSLAAETTGRHDLALRYLSGGLSWRPVYTADWRPTDGLVDLQAWAVLGNATGVDFDQAWVRLVAGQVHRVSRPQPRQLARGMKAEAAMMAAAAPLPSRQALAGYHLYRLPATVSLADGAEVQVALMPRLQIKAERRLVSEGSPQAFGVQRNVGEPAHPAIRLAFTTPKGDAAQPLPSGTVRLYGADAQGLAQFLGEDRIGDVPVGGKAVLNAGRAFDITVSRKQTSFRRESNRVFESGHQARLHNGGAKPARVQVVETLPGDWTILDSDRPHERDGGRAVWTIVVPAGGDAVLNYRVRVRN